jgi:hypothetical protein
MVVYTHKRKEIHYGHKKKRMQKCKEVEEEEEEEQEKEEKVYEQKQKEPIPLRDLQARMQCKETELEPKQNRSKPQICKDKTKSLFFLLSPPNRSRSRSPSGLAARYGRFGRRRWCWVLLLRRVFPLVGGVVVHVLGFVDPASKNC